MLSHFQHHLDKAFEAPERPLPGARNLAALAVGADERQLPTVAVWTIRTPADTTILLSPRLADQARAAMLAHRLAGIWPLLQAFRSSGSFRPGQVTFNLGDHKAQPGVNFCSRDRGDWLIPDPYFVWSRAYRQTRLAFGTAPAWSERIPAGFWRGATTGRFADDWRTLPRIALCRLSRMHSGILDAAFNKVVQVSSEAGAELVQAGLVRDTIPVERFAEWKYHIDIDGNSSSWPGLFQKLLTGSPVLKIASSWNWRQWYYDRLVPWQNFVPVDEDMADLIDKLAWLRDHDREAQSIGDAGRQLALSMSYEHEIAASIPVIADALQPPG